MFFGLFADSVLVNRYADMLFDEFVRIRNANNALTKAAQFANTENMSSKEIQKGKEIVAERLKKLGLNKGSGVPGTEKGLGSGNRSDVEGREASESTRLQSKGQGRDESSGRRLEAKEAAKF